MKKTEVRKLYRFRWKAFESVLCEPCSKETLLNNDYQSCFQIEAGVCDKCRYERNEKIVDLEKVEIIDNEIKELERLIRIIKLSKREIRIDHFIFYREGKKENLFRALSNPKNIRRLFQFPLKLSKETAEAILKDQITSLKERKKALLQKDPD